MVIGVILAGGDATRMGGGDKGLECVGGVAIIDRVAATLRAQCDGILISANGDGSRFARFGCPVVADDQLERRGPLAGILAGLDMIAVHYPQATLAVTAPTDTPFLPQDLVARLRQARDASAATIACARSGGIPHPVAALWPVALRSELRKAIDEEGLRKAQMFLERYPLAYADWPRVPNDPFFNVNTPDDLAAARSIATAPAS